MGLRKENYSTPEAAFKSVITAPFSIKILRSIVHTPNGADATSISREVGTSAIAVTNRLGYLRRAGFIEKLPKRGERRNVQPFRVVPESIFRHAINFAEQTPSPDLLLPRERECLVYFQKARPTQEGFMRCFKFNLRTADEKNLDWKTLASIMVESYHQAAHIRTATECGRLKK